MPQFILLLDYLLVRFFSRCLFKVEKGSTRYLCD
jgi:hypothetical protein